ncbi:MAG: histidine kinase [Lachnospiraceae bacterium]|nr:histidine kinase [Candidatus Colinaster scatohippi]
MRLKNIWAKTSAFFSDRIVYSTLYVIFAIIVFFSIYSAVDKMENESYLHEEYIPAVVMGEYSIDGGQTYNRFTDYRDIDIKGTNALIVRGRLTGGLGRFEKLYMFLDYINVSVYINDEIVYVSDEMADYAWDCLENVTIEPTDMVTFELSTKRHVSRAYGFRYFWENLNKSTKAAVLFHQIKSCFSMIFGDFVLLVVGILMIVTGIEYRYSSDENKYGIVNCGIATILGAIICFINPRYITLLFEKYELLEYIDTSLQMLSVLFLFSYFRKILRSDENKTRAALLVAISYTVTSISLLWISIGYPAGSVPIVFALVMGVIISLHYIWLFISDSVGIRNRMDFVAVGAALFLMVCTCIEMIYYLYTGVYIIHVLEIGFLGFAFVQFWFVVGKASLAQKEAFRLKDVENELTKAQVNSMISQIQPHFLYNALSTIRALCTKEPKRAREAIDQLSKYLRANMESLTSKESIPISKEIEHVECYLNIEKYRFGDKLNVEYDIQSTDFKVPSMVVQTLAENAVKHGLLAKPEGGTLKISTSESEYCYVVNIEDNGIGFDRTDAKNEGRIHVGIENSRKRLAAMCGGNLSIGSIAGKGTTVTICIPKNRKNYESNIN